MGFFDRFFLNNEITRLHQFFGDVSGKRAAIVGNALSLFEKTDGKLIDSYDLVVRLNSGFPIDYNVQGRRTDVVGLSIAITKQEVDEKFQGRPAIFWMTPKRKMIDKSLHKEDLYFYPKKHWKELGKNLGGNRPSTGMMMIDLLINHMRYPQVDLFGFDFKKTKTYYQVKEHVGPHRFDLEQEYVKKIIKNHGKIF